MNALAKFLLARIAEDEAEANSATVRVAAPNWLAAFDDGRGKTLMVDPDRVLAECDAKRQIIERLGPPHHLTGGSGAAYRNVLVYLALPYADHADFRPEWRGEVDV